MQQVQFNDYLLNIPLGPVTARELAGNEADMIPCPHGASQYKHDEYNKNRSHRELEEGIKWRAHLDQLSEDMKKIRISKLKG